MLYVIATILTVLILAFILAAIACFMIYVYYKELSPDKDTFNKIHPKGDKL